MDSTEALTSMPCQRQQDEEDSLKKLSADAIQSASMVNSSGCFDCNICLDFAVDPVVTLCGHLYCWPCLYKWLQLEEGNYSQSCPVCKASLSEDSLVPLYGRGKLAEPHHHGPAVPRPPALHRDHSAAQPHTSASRRPVQRVYPRYGFSSGSDSLTSSAMWGSPLLMAIAMLPLVFWNHGAAALQEGLYYSNPYHQAGLGGESPRLRRQELQVERYLSQILGFLFVGAFLCLLLF
ncbi:hypothetical protein HPP92_014674 [Vanilla planifolia]|uniref:E3 ubiquitin-protein ligase RMA n=1 Tax=Vanilla planifolia TaxID=51239 RepID=A0A835QNR5_VANPL|nr:hypothetical protein HPP92_014674 [Vanilla planifolia]